VFAGERRRQEEGKWLVLHLIAACDGIGSQWCSHPVCVRAV